jgi:hypothetical protein
MIRKLVAAVLGIAVAMLTIWVLERLGHFVYPPRADIDFGDPEEVHAFTATLPVGTIVIVGVAWAAGAFLGTLTGAALSRTKPLPYAILVGGIVLAGGITMLLVIPHPLWFTVSAPLAIIVAAYLGMAVAARLRPYPGRTA